MGSALESDTRGGIRSVRAARQLTTYVKDEKGRGARCRASTTTC
jgi:hypothetical protein